ncbi:MAG: hypothetical protein K8S99_00170 [Planctomycetes bacterium]|nr:hypothetical protein [Planctomycetota bacterium]
MNRLARSAAVLLALIAVASFTTHAFAAGTTLLAPPAIPTDLKGTDGVKTFLLTVLEGVHRAANDFQRDARGYAALVAKHGNNPAAAAAEPVQMATLIHSMRDGHTRIDSYGYEYVEGIVAGVPSLSKYDVELDAGVPKEGASPSDEIAPVVIKAGALTIDREGSLNNFLIEPTVFGTNEKFVAATVTLPGFDKPVGLPKPELVVALADYAVDGYSRLLRDARAWQPNDADCFHAAANMTPTLADYFEEWKESRIEGHATGGRFVGVSRVSDMRGIMSSTRLTWLAVADRVHAKDAALTEQITKGYEQVLAFIDKIESRESTRPLTPEVIDALGSQAKEKADRLAVQVVEAASLVGVRVSE